MLHRLIAICIVGFWLAMTGLLVVRELYPEATRLNAVPVSYVAQLIFQHEQSSDLHIRTAGQEARGYFHLQPRTDAATGRRVLDLSGSLPLSGERPQRISWFGGFEISPAMALERIRLNLSPPEPSQNVQLDIDLVGRTAKFGTVMGKEAVNERTISLDQNGFDSLMATAGVEPALVQQLKASRSELPKFSVGAQSSWTVIRKQKLATFLLTLKAGDQVLFEAHVSQLGQVLGADAPLLGLKLMLPE